MDNFCFQHQARKLQTALTPICALCWLDTHLAHRQIHDLFQVAEDWFEFIFLPRYTISFNPLPRLWGQYRAPDGTALVQADLAFRYVAGCLILFNKVKYNQTLLECRLRKGAYRQPGFVLLKADQAFAAVRSCYENENVPD